MAISQPGQDRRIFTFDGSKYMIVFRRSTIISQLIIETRQLIVGIEVHAVGSQYFTITLFSFRYPSEIDRIPGNGVQCIHIVRIHLQAMRKTLIGLLIAQQSLIRLPDCRHCSIIGWIGRSKTIRTCYNFLKLFFIDQFLKIKTLRLSPKGQYAKKQ